jgi:hypothetical protein
MITVIDAYALNGYSGYDHLIDDSKLKEIIGQEFRSVGEALKAADKRCFIDAPPTGRRRQHPYTGMKVRMADGSVHEHYSVK